MCHVRCIVRKRVALSQRTSGHQADRQIADTSIQLQQLPHWLQTGRVILDGRCSKHRLPLKWDRTVVRGESELVSALCPSAHPPQWCHHRHIPRHPLPLLHLILPPSSGDMSVLYIPPMHPLSLSTLDSIRDKISVHVWCKYTCVCSGDSVHH